jgi:uncharacterized membrane protein
VNARPRALIIAIVLLVLLSLANIAFIAAPSDEDGIPKEVLYLGVVLGIVGLVAAFGLWKGKRWALLAAVVVLLLSILSAAPGLVFAPSTELWISAVVGIAVSLLNLVLLLLPASRRFVA